MPERDCNTCDNHIQALPEDLQPSICKRCLKTPEALPYWFPIHPEPRTA